MRIPSGDLAPARRSRRRSRSGSGSRGRRVLPAVLVLALVAAAGGGAYRLLRDDDEPAADDTLARACPAPAAPASATPAPARPTKLPKPTAVRFRLLNGTDRDGLARRTGDALAARSFVVTKTGNPGSPLHGPSRVYYGPDGLPAATLLAAQVRDAELVARPKAAQDLLDLVLGSEFTRLNSPQEAAAVLTAPTPAPAPVPAPPAPAACP